MEKNSAGKRLEIFRNSFDKTTLILDKTWADQFASLEPWKLAVFLAKTMKNK